MIAGKLHDPTREPFDGHSLGAEPFKSTVTLDRGTPTLWLSDLHLGDGSTTDLFAGQDQRLIAFLEEQRRQVGAIVFLGDVVDLPQAWSTRRVRAVHGEIFRYLSDLVQSSQVIFLHGNHDWPVDYQALFPGALCHEAVLMGDRILAWHGHQMDLVMSPGARDATAKTYLHALLERLAGTRLVPPLEQHPSMANWAALSLAVAWARLCVTRAQALRSLGRPQQAAGLEARVRYLARSVRGDPADLYGATTRTVLDANFDTVVCGHSHLPGIAETHQGVYVNTGTWTCGIRTYGLWTGERFEVREVDTGREVHDENYVTIPPATEPHELFDWWLQQWRGQWRDWR